MSGNTILIVDDKQANIYSLETLLESKGYDVISCLNGKEALKLLFIHAAKIDLILLDVQMPEMEGFQTAEMIKARPKTSDIPILFLTAYEKEKAHQLKGFHVGAVDYLTKPLDNDVLLSRIAVFIQLKKTQDQLKEKETILQEVNSLLQVRVCKQNEVIEQNHQNLEENITKVKEINQALENSKNQYQHLIKNAPDPILIHQKGNICFANIHAVQFFQAGHADELIGTSILDRVHEDYRESVLDRMRIHSQDGAIIEALEIVGLTMNHLSLNLEVMGVPIIYQEEMAYLIVIRDLTVSKKAAEALLESESRFRTLVEASFNGVAVGVNGLILESNHSLCTMFGYNSQELQNQPVLDLINPTSINDFLKHLQSKEDTPFESVGVHKNGQIFDIEIIEKNTLYR
ncbi:MAG: PAS domain S-box-containing protein, partial [bacterium]